LKALGNLLYISINICPNIGTLYCIKFIEVAIHRKNHTQKPLYKIAESLIHIALQSIWHSGKLFIERKFGDKKIFSCVGASAAKLQAVKNKSPVRGFVIIYFLLNGKMEVH
jgi:hypothetical protein